MQEEQPKIESRRTPRRWQTMRRVRARNAKARWERYREGKGVYASWRYANMQGNACQSTNKKRPNLSVAVHRLFYQFNTGLSTTVTQESILHLNEHLQRSDLFPRVDDAPELSNPDLYT